MPTKHAPRTPSYRHHKPSGQAVVTLDGRDFYPGRWGTQESTQTYDRLVGEWQANGRRLSGGRHAGQNALSRRRYGTVVTSLGESSGRIRPETRPVSWRIQVFCCSECSAVWLGRGHQPVLVFLVLSACLSRCTQRRRE